MRLYGHALTGPLRIDLSSEEMAGCHVEVDAGTLTLLVEIDGSRQTVDIPAGRSWTSGPSLRRGIGEVILTPNPSATVTFDIGPDAGIPGAGVEISTNVKQGELSNAGLTITAGGTRQQALAANVTRRYLYIQNPPTETEDLQVNLGANAAADETSYHLQPGEGLGFEGTFVPTDAVDVLAATTGHQVVVKHG